METVDRDVYFEDVRLQMEAKLWGEEYNRHRPPKQVPVFIFRMLDSSVDLLSVDSNLVCVCLVIFTLG